MSFNFSGISGQMDERAIAEFGESTHDYGNEVIYESEPRTHMEEGFTFRYLYFVKAFDMGYATGEPEMDDKWHVELGLVVHPESISEELKDSIMGSNDGYFEIGDIVGHGGADVTFLSELVDESELDNKIKEAMSCMNMVDSMRGFYLDRAWNRIGTTGWDTLQYAVGKKDSLFF